MTEQMPSEQVAVDNKEALKTKRAGQTCITLFVVFVISLLSFGKAPLARVASSDGSRVNFNLISCLGIAMGVFAFVFLLAGFRRVLRLATAKKVLGLIGCFGLILHTILALFLPLSYGAGTPAAVGTAGNQPLAQSGPEEWIVEGKACRIASTYYLRLPEGFQYTIEYSYRFSQDDGSMDDDRALALVFPLMKHAYTNGLHTRASVYKLGQGAITPSRIGVTLFEKDGGSTRVYRVALSLDQVKKRIEQESDSNQ